MAERRHTRAYTQKLKEMASQSGDENEPENTTIKNSDDKTPELSTVLAASDTQLAAQPGDPDGAQAQPPAPSFYGPPSGPPPQGFALPSPRTHEYGHPPTTGGRLMGSSYDLFDQGLKEPQNSRSTPRNSQAQADFNAELDQRERRIMELRSKVSQMRIDSEDKESKLCDAHNEMRVIRERLNTKEHMIHKLEHEISQFMDAMDDAKARKLEQARIAKLESDEKSAKYYLCKDSDKDSDNEPKKDKSDSSDEDNKPRKTPRTGSSTPPPGSSASQSGLSAQHTGVHASLIRRGPPTFRGDRTSVYEDDAHRHMQKWTLSFDRAKNTLYDFIGYFNTHADLEGYSENIKCQQLLRSFGSDAARIVRRLGNNYTYETLIKVLYEYYEPVESRQAKMLRLRTVKRKSSESPRDFANRIQDLVSQCHCTMPVKEADAMAIVAFLHGHEEKIKNYMIGKNFASIDEAVNFVDTLEDSGFIKPEQSSTRDAGKSYAATANTTPHRRRATRVNLAREDSSDEDDCETYAVEVDAMIDVMFADDEDEDMYEDEVLETLASRVFRRFPQARNRGSCFYCGRQGHMWSRCRQLLERLRKNGMQSRRPQGQRRDYRDRPSSRSQAPPRGDRSRDDRYGNSSSSRYPYRSRRSSSPQRDDKSSQRGNSPSGQQRRDKNPRYKSAMRKSFKRVFKAMAAEGFSDSSEDGNSDGDLN